MQTSIPFSFNLFLSDLATTKSFDFLWLYVFSYYSTPPGIHFFLLNCHSFFLKYIEEVTQNKTSTYY